MKSLIIVPARAGSKGIPGKNSKELGGKPLISYTLEMALAISKKINSEVCVSTDDKAIIEITKKTGLEISFIRPEILSSDTASIIDVVKHALTHYNQQGEAFDSFILLQPTSPFRRLSDVVNAINLFKEQESADAVISVCESKANPYYNLFEEKAGYLCSSKFIEGLTRRQDAPLVYELNGAVYVVRTTSFMEQNAISTLNKAKKMVMPFINSVDIDSAADWNYCEFIIQNKLININNLINT